VRYRYVDFEYTLHTYNPLVKSFTSTTGQVKILKALLISFLKISKMEREMIKIFL